MGLVKSPLLKFLVLWWTDCKIYIYAQSPILSCDKLLSGIEISTMEMYVLLFSQLLIHACHFHYTVRLLSSLRAGYSFFAKSFTFLLSSVVLMFQSFWDFPLLLKTELFFFLGKACLSLQLFFSISNFNYENTT